ncbi:hypothetical protein E2C01_084109 [Portunus trituberculatus]|uniref:Uncharacterized protein n=1 Tax=Portunus trituberculatus TaxID=210409 RepID=A0A5B7J9T4_PORTR|nr:hypothetical protein [Portunus trituberculatus]
MTFHSGWATDDSRHNGRLRG